MKNIFFLLLCISNSLFLIGQENENLPPNYIRSIQLHGDSLQENGNPVINMGERLHLSFDDIIGDEADYYYQIEHFDHNWAKSQLAKAEYLEGIDNIRIFNYENSYNTLQSYSHYRLSIPNEESRGLKVSGNYMIKIFNGGGELVFSRKFMVTERLAVVPIQIKRSRNLNFIETRQVLNFSIDPREFLLKNPDQTIRVVLIQNHNLKSAITDLKPQFTMGNELIYRYDQESSFWGGNEYLMFDNKELRASTADINYVDVDRLYHHHLFPDRSRAGEPYTYNPDINGGFVIRSLNARDPNIEAEYTWVHFNLINYDDLQGGEPHIFGGFNNFQTDESTKLTYNQESGQYEGARLFKQGFYNYKYVLKRADGSIDEGFFSGNHDETENTYQVLVYYRDLGARYDRLIGVGRANSTVITN